MEKKDVYDYKIRTNDRLKLLLFFVYFSLAFCITSEVFPARGYIMSMVSLLVFLLSTNRGKISFTKNFSTGLIPLLSIYYLDIASNAIAGALSIQNVAYAIQYTCISYALVKTMCNNRLIIEVLKTMYYPAFVGGPIIGLYQMYSGSYIFPRVLTEIEAQDITSIIATANNYNANYVAVSMCFTLFLGLLLFQHTRNKLYAVLCVVSVICILLTYSRAAIIAILISIFIVMVLTRKSRKKYINPWQLIAIAVIAVVLFISYDRIMNAIVTFTTGDAFRRIVKYKTGTSAFNGREILWMTALKVFATSNPVQWIVGIGSSKYPEIAANFSGSTASAHNLYLQQLCNNGMLGFIAIIFAMIKQLKGLYDIKDVNNISKTIFASTIMVAIFYVFVSNIMLEIVVTFIIGHVAITSYNYKNEG